MHNIKEVLPCRAIAGASAIFVELTDDISRGAMAGGWGGQ